MKHPYAIIHRCLTVVLVGIMALSAGSCADENLAESPMQGDRGVAVNFNVGTAQEKLLTQPQQPLSMSATRAAFYTRLSKQRLQPEDLDTRRLEAQGVQDACIIETTVEGINAVLLEPGTRAQVKTAIDANFSSSAYRSTTAGFIPGTPDWFYKAETQSNGQLVSPLQWSWSQRYARFYAVYPEATTTNNIALSPATHNGTPYLDFEVKQNVTDQIDLMTACSGEVEYAIRGMAPRTDLDFYHALTAVKIAVGQNLSWNKHITKVELQNTCSRGRFHFSDQTDGTGAYWDVDNSSRTTFTLNLPTPVSTSSLPNQVLVGKDNDNYTFYMIPQPLAGITLRIEFSDATAMNIPLSGTWRPATTKTYKLSNTTSNWQYSFTITRVPITAAYNQTNAGTYIVQSFREDPSALGVKHAVAWRIAGYEEYDYTTDNWIDRGMNKPDWFDELTNVRTQTGNYIAGDYGSVKVKTAVLVNKSDRDDKLKLDPKGSPGNYYDLSTHNIKGQSTSRNTANCYVISHPGYYKIPLVYGNAIKNGNDYPEAYTSSAAVNLVGGNDVTLHHFKDHNSQNITNPWIEKTNSGANNGVNGAKVVWADEANLVHFDAANTIVRSGGATFLQFEVKPEHIKNGNAVVAVTKNNIVVWSWHLWFAPDNVLDKVEVTNHGGKKYYFTSETLGFTYSGWQTTGYSKVRKIKIKIEQVAGNGVKKSGEIIAEQNPGSRTTKWATTLYQWGRKDAFPGMTTVAEGNFVSNAGPNISIKESIQNPHKHYITDASQIWEQTSNDGNTGYGYYNLWSINNTINQVQGTGNDHDVKKTIYDPCPAGFKVSPNNAFTGFTTTGNNTIIPEEFNVEGVKDNVYFLYLLGWNMWTNNSHSTTNYFPAGGYRLDTDGRLMRVGSAAYYWSAIPTSNSYSCSFSFGGYGIHPLYTNHRANGFAIHPIADN